MISTILLVCVVCIVLAAVIYVLDLCLNVLFKRLQVPDDLKTALRALIALCLFLFIMGWLLNTFGILPRGWW